MDSTAIIGVCGTVILTLAGVIAWLVKRDYKDRLRREKEVAQREEKYLVIIQNNNVLHEKTLQILGKLEGLLTNWRGH